MGSENTNRNNERQAGLKTGRLVQARGRRSHSLLPQTLLPLLVQQAWPWLVAAIGARVAAIIGGRGCRSKRGTPLRRGPLSRTRSRAGAVRLVSRALTEATQRMAQAIPITEPRTRARARAATPRGAGRFAGLRAPRRTATFPPGGLPFRATRARHRSHGGGSRSRQGAGRGSAPAPPPRVPDA